MDANQFSEPLGSHHPGHHLDGSAAGRAQDSGSRLGGLIAGAVGVVYGDLGTSPLYTLRECFGSGGMTVTPGNVLGLLSVIFWALMLVVTLKYVIFVMRADNHGEGGILALLALARRTVEGQPGRQAVLTVVGLVGAALFYGDGMVTPAISVLSAIEGLEVATSAFKPFVLPLTVVVLVALFMAQRHGTENIGKLFGPVMGLWFVCIGMLGGIQIFAAPQVLQALDPSYAIGFFAHHGWRAFVALGAVVLALTGAEALYADMGHFGKKSIRIAWFAVVMPSLVLNYFGQGALLLGDPAAVRNPFFLLAPSWGLLPLVLLSTVATVIASQAVISGAFSLTRQAIQLGYCPRMEVRHTSVTAMGQIYIPTLNWTLLVAVLVLVLGFKSSSNLAAAYGIAVTGTMASTTILSYFVMRHIWGWSRMVSLPIICFFLIIDFSFLGSNLLKVAAGGWFPLAAGALAFLLMSTWKRGREALLDSLAQPSGTLERFIAGLNAAEYRRIEGTAVFLTGSRHGVPYALVHNLRHNAVLHQRVLVMTVSTEDVPFVPMEHRVLVKDMGRGFYRIWIRYGFKEHPDLPKMLNEMGGQGMGFDMEHTSFFLGRETLVPGPNPALPPWRLQLFMAMSHNAGSAAAFFRLPVDRVIELGAQVAL